MAAASRDGDGNTIGLVINPPYPRFTDKERRGPDGASGLLLGAMLAVGLLLGWGLTRLAQRLSR